MGRGYEREKRYHDPQRDCHEARVQLRPHVCRFRYLARFGTGTASRHHARSQHIQRCHLWHFLSWQRSNLSFSLTLQSTTLLQKSLAQSLVQQMEKDGFLPCVDTLNALLMLYVKGRLPRDSVWVRHFIAAIGRPCVLLRTCYPRWSRRALYPMTRPFDY